MKTSEFNSKMFLVAKHTFIMLAAYMEWRVGISKRSHKEFIQILHESVEVIKDL